MRNFIQTLPTLLLVRMAAGCQVRLFLRRLIERTSFVLALLLALFDHIAGLVIGIVFLAGDFSPARAPPAHATGHSERTTHDSCNTCGIAIVSIMRLSSAANTRRISIGLFGVKTASFCVGGGERCGTSGGVDANALGASKANNAWPI